MPTSNRCLDTLASVDWNLARAIAKSLPAGGFGDSRSLLTRFESPNQFAAEMGFDAGVASGAILLFGGLEGARLALPASFLSHLRMLDNLQELARELDDAVFLTTKAKRESDSATVTAWLGDRRYDLALATGCNVEDPNATIGLLNVLMRDAPTTRRYYAVEALGSLRAYVMVFEPARLKRLVSAGLLRVIDPETASARGATEDDD